MIEHVHYLEALKNHGKNWRKVEEHVQTRTSTQARSHAQKFFANILKRNMTMEQFLDILSIDTINELKEKAQTKDAQNYHAHMHDLGDEKKRRKGSAIPDDTIELDNYVIERSNRRTAAAAAALAQNELQEEAKEMHL